MATGTGDRTGLATTPCTAGARAAVGVGATAALRAVSGAVLLVRAGHTGTSLPAAAELLNAHSGSRSTFR